MRLNFRIIYVPVYSVRMILQKYVQRDIIYIIYILTEEFFGVFFI